MLTFFHAFALLQAAHDLLIDDPWELTSVRIVVKQVLADVQWHSVEDALESHLLAAGSEVTMHMWHSLEQSQREVGSIFTTLVQTTVKLKSIQYIHD